MNSDGCDSVAAPRTSSRSVSARTARGERSAAGGSDAVISSTSTEPGSPLSDTSISGRSGALARSHESNASRTAGVGTSTAASWNSSPAESRR